VDLVKQETIEYKNKKYSSKKGKVKTLKGVLRVHPRGFGFFQPDPSSKDAEEVFIPKHLIKDAVDGDTVEIEVNPHSNWEKGPDGKVTTVIKRGRSHLGGTVYTINSKGTIYAHCPLLGASKPVIVESKKKVKVGDRIILKVITWASEEHPTQGEVTHILGHISDPSIDIEAAIKEYDLNASFPKSVMNEAEKWGSEVAKKDLEKRNDLTALKTITIDPETAKDFDDALSISKDEQGLYHLAVHIADVAHYVSKDSCLDKEAFERCNSTYFPGFCLPMLPHELSSNLCSLQPGVIRLTVSVLMIFNAEGALLSSKIVRSYIKSNKRFTYEEAKEVLDGKKKSPFFPSSTYLSNYVTC
jgi:ribonuclease R